MICNTYFLISLNNPFQTQAFVNQNTKHKYSSTTQNTHKSSNNRQYPVIPTLISLASSFPYLNRDGTTLDYYIFSWNCTKQLDCFTKDNSERFRTGRMRPINGSYSARIRRGGILIKSYNAMLRGRLNFNNELWYTLWQHCSSASRGLDSNNKREECLLYQGVLC